MPVGQHDRVGRDDPAVEGGVAHVLEVQVDAGDLTLSRRSSSTWSAVCWSSRRTEPTTSRSALLGEPGEGSHRPVEALVGLDEPDAEEDVLVLGSPSPARAVARSADVCTTKSAPCSTSTTLSGGRPEAVEQLVALLDVCTCTRRRPRIQRVATDDGSRGSPQR